MRLTDLPPRVAAWTVRGLTVARAVRASATPVAGEDRARIAWLAGQLSARVGALADIAFCLPVRLAVTRGTARRAGGRSRG